MRQYAYRSTSARRLTITRVHPPHWHMLIAQYVHQITPNSCFHHLWSIWDGRRAVQSLSSSLHIQVSLARRWTRWLFWSVCECEWVPDEHAHQPTGWQDKEESVSVWVCVWIDEFWLWVFGNWKTEKPPGPSVTVQAQMSMNDLKAGQSETVLT